MKKESTKLNGTASCESYIEGYGPSNACDGKKGTFWKAEPYFKWWLLDLEKPCFVDYISLVLGHDGEYYHYHIEYSLDRINWFFLYEKKNNNISTAEGDLIKVNQNARFIKITISYCSNSSVVSIENVTVLGCETELEEKKKCIECEKTKAIYADETVGFNFVDNYPIDSNWNDSVVETNKVGSYLLFKDIDFDNNCYDQLRMYLGLPIKDKTLYLNIEFRLDSISGEKIGNIHLCRQYTYFTELAIELLRENNEKVKGKHDLYILLTEIALPQTLVIYWLNLTKRQKLSDKVMDYKDELISDNKPYNVYFGDNHCHTGLTDGFGTPDHAYDYARHVAKMDFLGITEHSNCLDEMFDCDKSFKWRDLRLASERATENGKFVGLYGSETTWYNQFGHMNIYCADFYINSYEFKYDNAITYYEELKKHPGIVSQWNHPWSCGNRHLDWFEPYDEELDKITYTIELNNLELSGDDVLKYYIIALDKGWHLSPVGNQDNHKEDWGTQNGMRTAIIARRLTAADIYDAIKNRRTYFSGIPGFRVIYAINNNIQGSIIEYTDELILNVRASCDDGISIKEIEVYGENGKIIKTLHCNDKVIDFNYKIDIKQRYYFLKLIRKDNQIAVTAPIWIE